MSAGKGKRRPKRAQRPAIALAKHVNAERDRLFKAMSIIACCRLACASLLDQGGNLELRDRALLALLYGTGIRASECAGLREGQVDLRALAVTVRGKGGHERTVPFNEQVGARLREYVQVRGPALPSAPFFRSRFGKPISRGTVYERVRTLARRARLAKPMSPHRLRHTFASHLVREGVGLVTIRDLLGHRLITSTQIYLHVTAQDLRAAAERHPIARLLSTIEHLLPHVRLPFQRPGARCATA